MTGVLDLGDQHTACGMPVSVQIERLERALGERRVEVVESDFYSLEGDDLQAALDALVACKPSPLVLMNGQLVCSGAVEIDAVLSALG